MITNDRQYRITNAQLKKLERALLELAEQDEAVDSLVGLSMEALRSEIEVLRSELLEYVKLREGSSESFAVASLRDLPVALIRARIARGMSQRNLAEALGLKEQQIQRYEATEYLSASLRRLLQIASIVGVDVTSEASTAASTPSAGFDNKQEFDWSRFPVKEMYRRRWFDGFQGSLDAAIHASETLVQDYLRSVYRQPSLAFHRKHVRVGSMLDEYALLAWESRVLHLGACATVGSRYTPGSITDTWLADLVRLSSQPRGPLLAQEALAEIGIPLVVEPQLPGTHLDGASLLLGDVPVVGLTLRHDRLDNFWFVLLHELAHVHTHLRKGKLTGTFDDLDARGDDRIEQEADHIAKEALLPGSVWELAMPRYVRSPESVTSFADKLGISPAIVAGRIRFEARNYVILSDLVGTGQVRRLFNEVEFDA